LRREVEVPEDLLVEGEALLVDCGEQSGTVKGREGKGRG
jgi:hypothetical protein